MGSNILKGTQSEVADLGSEGGCHISSVEEGLLLHSVSQL